VWGSWATAPSMDNRHIIAVDECRQTVRPASGAAQRIRSGNARCRPTAILLLVLYRQRLIRCAGRTATKPAPNRPHVMLWRCSRNLERSSSGSLNGTRATKQSVRHGMPQVEANGSARSARGTSAGEAIEGMVWPAVVGGGGRVGEEREGGRRVCVRSGVWCGHVNAA